MKNLNGNFVKVSMYPKELSSTEGVDMWIDPGTASPEDIAELFTAYSDLYKLFGGSGLNFVVYPSENVISDDIPDLDGDDFPNP